MSSNVAKGATGGNNAKRGPLTGPLLYWFIFISYRIFPAS